MGSPLPKCGVGVIALSRCFCHPFTRKSTRWTAAFLSLSPPPRTYHSSSNAGITATAAPPTAAPERWCRACATKGRQTGDGGAGAAALPGAWRWRRGVGGAARETSAPGRTRRKLACRAAPEMKPRRKNRMAQTTARWWRSCFQARSLLLPSPPPPLSRRWRYAGVSGRWSRHAPGSPDSSALQRAS